MQHIIMMDEKSGRGRGSGRGRRRGISRPDKSPISSPYSLTRRLENPVPTRNQRLAASEEKIVNHDWLELESHDDLLLRLNMFNLGSSVDDEAFMQSDQEKSKPFLQQERFVRGNLKQVLCDLKKKPKQTHETLAKNQIERTLEYFKNVMKGGDYEFVSCDTLIPVSLFVTHANFHARLKGTNSPPELFFAVLENGCPHEATHCCKLDGSRTLQPGEVVCHCEHVECSRCAEFHNYVIRPGEDFIM